MRHTAATADEARFLRAYSKALADALLANESDPAPPPSPSVIVRDTYVALCHDDPTVTVRRGGGGGGDEACRLLAERLVRGPFGSGLAEENDEGRTGKYGREKSASGGAAAAEPGVTVKRRGGGGGRGGGGRAASTAGMVGQQVRGRSIGGGGGGGKKSDIKTTKAESAAAGGVDEISETYALSDRLVGGILQVSARTAGSAASTSSDAAAATAGGSDSARRGELLSSTVTADGVTFDAFGAAGLPATAEGYAVLAFAAFARGPLLCVRAGDDLGKVREFLGSYRGNSREKKSGDSGGKKDGEDGKGGDEEERVEALLGGIRSMAVDDAKRKAAVASTSAAEEEKKAERRDSGSSSSSSGFFASHVQQHGNNDLAEIFADESDPDDFEYESSRFDGFSSSAASAGAGVGEEGWAGFGAFDPAKLSAPDATLDWEGCRERVHSLLSELMYSKVACLGCSRWEELKCSDTLAHLTEELLRADVVAGVGDGDVAAVGLSPLLREPWRQDEEKEEMAREKGGGGGGVGPHLLAAEWHRPMACLRDRAVDSRWNHDALERYVALIRKFLSSPEDLGGGSGMGVGAGRRELSRTRAVGLSSLSSLCGLNGLMGGRSSKEDRAARGRVRAAIVDSLEDLAETVEAVRPEAPSSLFGERMPAAVAEDGEEGMVGEEQQGWSLPPWVHVTLCVLPILQALTGVRSADLASPDGSDGAVGFGVTTQEAQSLLSSGLFREMIMLYAGAKPPPPSSDGRGEDTSENLAPALDRRRRRQGTRRAASATNAETALRSQLLRALLVLSAQSPAVLGKYAARVPELAAELQSVEFREGNAVDGVLWVALLLSSSPPGTGGGSGRLRLRSKGSGALPAAAPTSEELWRTYVDGLVTLCREVRSSLERNAGGGGDDDDNARLGSSLSDFVQLSNGLKNLPHLGNVWAISLKEGGRMDKLRGALADIRSALTKLPRREIETGAKAKGEDRDEKPDRPLPRTSDWERKMFSNDEKVVAVRKAVKIVTLLLESSNTGQGPGMMGTSETGFALSSKTD